MVRKPDKRPGARGSASRRRSPAGGAVWIHGRHAVEAALRNPERRILRLVATGKAAAGLRPLVERRADGPALERVDRAALDRLLERGAVHQGAAIEAAPLPERALDDLGADDDLVVVLDRVTDPRNLGAILRSCAAFGAGAVVLQDRHSPRATGTLAKAASGALEWVPLVRVANLARALDRLKGRGYWIVGLDGDSDRVLGRVPLRAPLALVLGAEGSGLRRLTREACDIALAIPTARSGLGLNVSNAAAVALHEARRALADRTGPWYPDRPAPG